jgi:chaperonin GroEL (HSP60 family)
VELKKRCSEFIAKLQLSESETYNIDRELEKTRVNWYNVYSNSLKTWVSCNKTSVATMENLLQILHDEKFTNAHGILEVPFCK